MGLVVSSGQSVLRYEAVMVSGERWIRIPDDFAARFWLAPGTIAPAPGRLHGEMGPLPRIASTGCPLWSPDVNWG